MKTIKNYLSHLNPKLDCLFQRPREARSFKPGEDKVWYCNSPLGVNILDSMLKLMSSRAGIYPGYQRFFSRCTSFVRPKAEDTSGEAARKTSGSERFDLLC